MMSWVTKVSRFHPNCLRYFSKNNCRGWINERKYFLPPSIVCRSTSLSSFPNHGNLDDNQSQAIARLTEAYRNHGHKLADVNPLNHLDEPTVVELDPACYGLKLDEKLSQEQENLLVKDVVDGLKAIYCGSISLETSTVECSLEKEWLFSCFAETQARELPHDLKRQICELMVESQNLDNFLGTKFPTLKRYGGEGAESMLPFFHQFLRSACDSGVEQVFVGTAHRGRNNLLVGQLNFPLEVMFRKIKGLSEFPESALSIATGDVLSHLNISTDLDMEGGRKLHVNLLGNPSFLEAVNPVAAGKCRGRQQTLGEGPHRGSKAVCLLMHGDASFTGQGIVMECFNMTKLPGFDVGGIVHLIVNNQLGFTTPSELGRSSPYASDIGKMIGCPVIRVNGDEPEQLLKAAEIAAKYRHEYKKDIIIDMLCYRKWGHNELDDPTFTQPLMYRDIHGRQSVPDKYTDKLIEAGVVDKNTVDQWIENSSANWNSFLKKCDNYVPEPIYLAPDSPWGKMSLPNVNHVTTWDTGCHGDELRYIGAKSVEVHEDFAMHEHLTKLHAEARVEKLQTDSLVDWALAETFAFGSLLNQGYDIRLCGQDVGRGTFSHRHAVFNCQQSGNYHIPLNHMLEDQKAQIEVVCSLLSEEAVTGFEYGMSIENPDRLVIWEAQFGDFFTGAQIIFDTFITSGEAKWMYQSGLVILLPHGYDGAGPEHSSCRIERFLQGTNSSEDSVDGDGVNISVCHPTTSAQYFHLLRRQMVRNFRKPLIVVSPKILLRLPAAMSHMKDFQPGTHFLPVIGDSSVKEPQRVKKVVLCSGKHCYALEKERSKLIKTEDINQSDVAIVKLEELCPFPAAELQRELSKYQSAEAYVWSQEEPRNMGPWTFVSPRFENLLGVKLKFAGRRESAAPAVGIGGLHRQEVEKLMKETFA